MGRGTNRVAYINKKSGQWNAVAAEDAPAYLAPDLGPVSAETLRAFGEMSAVGMTAAQMNDVLSQYFGTNYAARMANGSNSLVDRDNILYANFGTGIYAFGLIDNADPPKGIEVLCRIDDASVIQGGAPGSARIVGLSLTYDGHLIVTFTNGVAVIDRSLDVRSSYFYRFGSDDDVETVGNSIAVDEKNGIYVASDKVMRKLVWTGTGLSDKEIDGAWSSPYDAPSDEVPPVIKFGPGTGSTPTLMGFGSDPDKLVVITDGARHMKLVAFWRDAIPDWFVQKQGTASRRIAGQIQVTCGFDPLPAWIQSEQSVVVHDYGAFVVNNIPANADNMDIAYSKNKILEVSLIGPAYETALGVQRFEWNPVSHEWVSVWTRPDVSSTSMVPTHSQSKNMALVNGYTDKNGREVTGLDWGSGVTVHQTFFGRQNFGNGAYALLQYLENGDLLFDSISGPFRVHYGN